MKQNQELRNVYHMLLQYVKDRINGADGVNPSEVERKFLDVIKLIVEGGWTIEEDDFYQIIDMVEAGNNFSYEIYFFFLYFVDNMKFDKTLFDEYCIKHGANLDKVELRIYTVNRAIKTDAVTLKNMV